MKLQEILDDLATGNGWKVGGGISTLGPYMRTTYQKGNVSIVKYTGMKESQTYYEIASGDYKVLISGSNAFRTEVAIAKCEYTLNQQALKAVEDNSDFNNLNTKNKLWNLKKKILKSR